MKKLLFLPILTLACFATLSNSWGAATYNCSHVKNTESNDEDGNNFLYLDVEDMNDKKSFFCGHKGTTGCDNSQYIRIIGTPYMDGNNATGFHAFRCNHDVDYGIFDKRAWQHITGVEDIQTCSDINGKTLIATLDGMNYYTNKPGNWQKYNDRTWYSKTFVPERDFDGLCRIETDKISELANKCTKTDFWPSEQNCPNETQFKNAEKCFRGCPNGEYVYTIQLCKEGYTRKDPSKYKVGYDRCVKNPDGDDEKRDDSESSLEKCLRERAGMSAEALACCYLRSTVAKYNFQTQKCECVNDGTFEIAPDGRGGTCKAPGGDGDDGRSVTPPDDDESTVQPVVTETYKCDPTKLAFISKWQIDCKDKQNIITQIEVINAHCNGLNPEKETFDTYYKMLQALNPDECAIENARKAAEEQIRARKVQEFKSKFSTLEKIEGGFGDKSVWKNKDGKFNTARLASDSIAGVVLGTAGGLITSHVVKKNQEKSGFEDIKCTVGGQEIGDFGDQMNVGIN